MAIFGKSIGNGYPISAILGKKNIMQVAQETFISSTMWTDRLGFIAANETLKKLKKHKIHKNIILWKYYQKRLDKNAKKHKIDISISGLDNFIS